MTPQWDKTLQVSHFLPDQWSAANAPRLYVPRLHRCLSLLGQQPDRRGSGQPRPTRWRGASSGGSFTHDRPTRFNGAFQAGQGINDTMYSGNAFKISPRFGFVYDVTGEGRTIVRGGFGIFYDRPQGNIVFDMIANAPGLLQLAPPVGAAPGRHRRRPAIPTRPSG